MEERYYVIMKSCDPHAQRTYEVRAWPTTLESAKKFLEDYVKKDPVNHYLIAKAVLDTDVNVNIEYKDV